MINTFVYMCTLTTQVSLTRASSFLSFILKGENLESDRVALALLVDAHDGEHVLGAGLQPRQRELGPRRRRRVGQHSGRLVLLVLAAGVGAGVTHGQGEGLRQPAVPARLAPHGRARRAHVLHRAVVHRVRGGWRGRRAGAGLGSARELDEQTERGCGRDIRGIA